MKRLSIIFTALLLAVALPMEAQAQTEIKVGPRLGVPLGDISDMEGNFFFGADARIDSEGLPVVINPSIDYYLMDDRSTGFGDSVGQTLITVDGNVLYEFDIEDSSFIPFAGGGIAITRWSIDNENISGDTDVGLNLVGGARFPLDSFEPFVQANFGLGDLDRFGLAGGLLFSF